MAQEKIKINKGIFNFLMKQHLHISTMRHVLKEYALTKDKKPPKKNRNQWYADISEEAQTDFKGFKKVFNKLKDTIPQHLTYDEWWNECNLDGTFAYNNSSDDF